MQTDLVAFTKATASWNGLQTPDLGYATVTVVPDTPELTVTAPPTIPVGGRTSAAVTLAGTHPDGTLTFALFGPADPNCVGAPVYTTTISVNGNGTFQSPAVVATRDGIYRWKASYGGDEDNDAASSACDAADAATEVVADEPLLPEESGRSSCRSSPCAWTASASAARPSPRVDRNEAVRDSRQGCEADEGQDGQGNHDQVRAVGRGGRHDHRGACLDRPALWREMREGDEEAQAQEALHPLRQGHDAQARA